MRTPEARAARKANREQAIRLLNACEIMHTVYDNGAYLYVEDGKGGVDFWPSNGNWVHKVDRAKRGRGVVSLINYIQRAQRSGSPPRPVSNSARQNPKPT